MSRRIVLFLPAALLAQALLATTACSPTRAPAVEPAEPRPTRSVALPYDQLLEPAEPSVGGAPEVTAAANSSLALVLEEPEPKTRRWVLLYTPPFLSAESSTFLPQGDHLDPRARSVFVFSPIKSGRDEVEFGRISLTSTAGPSMKAGVTINAE